MKKSDIEIQSEEKSLGEMKQIRISIPKGVIDYYKIKQVTLGYSAYSHVISEALTDQYEIEKEETGEISEVMEQYRQYNKIGNSASKMRGRKFAISNAVDDLNDTLIGYDNNPWLGKQRRQNFKKEAIIEHVMNTRREILKKYSDMTENKFKKNSTKFLKRKLKKLKEWYDEQYISVGKYRPNKATDKKLVLLCNIELELERRTIEKRTPSTRR